ncbi:hypothetical protein E2C01_051141 [Portunus trituberculatus]|uniref:Uncharacterized protein n=1 Tax=Portunus trituberculatus TaxID=210409 RepID=A0A5B7GHT6_PORTR|nr:hypothetical protein [Portunus trituberculatus]
MVMNVDVPDRAEGESIRNAKLRISTLFSPRQSGRTSNRHNISECLHKFAVLRSRKPRVSYHLSGVSLSLESIINEPHDIKQD